MAAKPKILVLGASECVGGYVARTLCSRGYPVRASRRPNRSAEDIDPGAIEWVQASADQPDTLDVALEGCRGVVYAAGRCGRCPGLDINRARRDGVARVRHVLDACLQQRIPRVVYMSSPVTLGGGSAGDDVLNEDAFYVPGSVQDAHVEARWAMEAEVYRYVRRGMPAMIIIPSFVAGPGHADRPIGPVLEGLASGTVPALIDGRFNAVDARDVADSTVAVLERGRPGRRYILGGVNTTVDAFAELVCDQAGVDKPRFHLPAAPADKIAGVARRLGERLKVSLPEVLVGLQRLSRGRHLSDERARAELDHQSRALETTVADALKAWSR